MYLVYPTDISQGWREVQLDFQTISRVKVQVAPGRPRADLSIFMDPKNVHGYAGYSGSECIEEGFYLWINWIVT